MMATPINCDEGDPRPNWSVLLESEVGGQRTLVQWVGNAETEAAAIDAGARTARMARAILAATTGATGKPVDAVLNCCDGEDVPPNLTVGGIDGKAVGGAIADLGRLASAAAAAALLCGIKGALGRGGYDITVGVGKHWHQKSPYAVTIRGDRLTGDTHPRMDERLRDALMAFAIACRAGSQTEEDVKLTEADVAHDHAGNVEKVTSLLRRLGLGDEADAFFAAYGH